MYKRFLISFCLIAVILLCLKNISFGTSKYIDNNNDIILEIPRLFFDKITTQDNKVIIHSFKSKYVLEKSMNKIISNYERVTCNNKTNYYDAENNITIIDYNIKSNFLTNDLYIEYTKESYAAERCNKIKYPELIKYKILSQSTDICELYNDFKYKNEDGNLYNIYYDCIDGLLIENGSGYMTYLQTMLFSNFMGMEDLIAFFEYRVDNNEATKELIDDSGTILYKTDYFSLLKCNTIEGNKDVYIGNEDFVYKESYCKF